MNSEDNGGTPFEEDKSNPFLLSHAMSNATPSPDTSLSYSVSSSQSFDKKLRKQLKKQAILRSLFLAWRGYAVQVKRDKVLFVRIRDFIIRRLTRAAYKAMKVHYVTKGIIRHKRRQGQLRMMNEVISAWKTALEWQKDANRIMGQVLSQAENKMMLRYAFNKIEEHSIDTNLLTIADGFQKTNAMRKIIQVFKNTVQERIVKREWALKVMIAQDDHGRRLVELAYQGFRFYVKLAKRHKRLRIKALKLFARTTKKHGFAQWKLYITLQHRSRELNLFALNFHLTSQNHLLCACFHAWIASRQLLKERSERLCEVLTRTQQIRVGFEAIRYAVQCDQAKVDEMRKRRVFKMLRENKLRREAKREITRQLEGENVMRVKLRCMKAWREGVQRGREQKDRLQEVIDRMEIRQGFMMLKRAAQVNQGLQKLSSFFQTRSKRQIFRWLRLNSLLSTILSDTRLSLISLRLRFLHWKEESECDRRLAKMLIRASKHHNRVLLPKAFLALKRLVFPPLDIMPSRRLQLGRAALERWRLYMRARRVKSYKQEKAQQKYRYTQMRKCLTYMVRVAQEKQGRRSQLNGILNKYRNAKNRRIIQTVLQALIKQAYLRRVQNYLNANKNNVLRATYFQRFKDAYLAQHTESYKLRKAESHEVYRLLSKSLMVLYHYRKNRFIKQVKLQRAVNLYWLRLMRIGLIALWQNRSKKVEKRNAIQQAMFEHQKEKLQAALLKLVQVGIYWSQIKGRFGSGKHSRIYLGLKYGLRWRARALLSRFKPRTNESIFTLCDVQVSSGVTEVVRKQLFPQINSSMRNAQAPVISRTSINFKQGNLRPMSATIRTEFPSSGKQDRIGEIEREITQFKQKKMLLKELEDQLQVLSQSQQQSPVTTLLSQKISGLRQELQTLQPKIKAMLQEISSLKQQPPPITTSTGDFGTASQRQNVLLTSPGLSSIQQPQRRIM